MIPDEPDLTGQDIAPLGQPPRLLTSEQIRAAADLATKTVEIPEWGGAVTLSALAYDDYQKVVAADTEESVKRDPTAFGKRLVVAMCDQLDDSALEWIGQKNPGVLARLVNASRELMPVGPAEVPAAEATFPSAPESSE